MKVRSSREFQVESILKELNSASNSIEASAVMSRDGLSIASVLREGVDPDRLGAMCAALLSLADKTARELHRGRLKQVLIDGETGYLLIVHVGENAVLSVVSRSASNLGMVFVEARKTSEKIAALL